MGASKNHSAAFPEIESQILLNVRSWPLAAINQMVESTSAFWRIAAVLKPELWLFSESVGGTGRSKCPQPMTAPPHLKCSTAIKRNLLGAELRLCLVLRIAPPLPEALGKPGQVTPLMPFKLIELILKFRSSNSTRISLCIHTVNILYFQ